MITKLSGYIVRPRLFPLTSETCDDDVISRDNYVMLSKQFLIFPKRQKNSKNGSKAIKINKIMLKSPKNIRRTV